VAGRGRVQKRRQGVEHHEPRPRLREQGVQGVEIVGEAHRGVLAVVTRDDQHAIQVGAEAGQAGARGVGRVVLAVEDDDVARPRPGGAVGHRPARAEPGAEVQRDQRLAQLGVALQERELAEGEPARPEPRKTLRRNGAKWERLEDARRHDSTASWVNAPAYTIPLYKTKKKSKRGRYLRPG